MLERAANYNWKLVHIKGKHNKVCDALSGLCMQICLYSHKNVNKNPKLLSMSKRASIRKNQLEEDDPLVMKIAEEGNLDIAYLEMLNAI